MSYVNESFRRMLQERSEQVVGRSATSVGARWKAVASGSSDAESAGGLFAPGEVSAPLDLQVGSRIIEVSEFRVEDARSRLERGYIFTDETEARQVDRLKNEFVGIASHELRTPLTGILGFASLLAESEELPEAERHWAELIEHESSRLAKIVTDLLNVSRIESGELEAEEAPVPIGELIEGVVGTFRGASAEHQLRVEGPTDQVVRGDRGKLTEVLGNLVDNAIKQSPAGGAVTIECVPRAQELEVRVRDSSLGIPEHEIPNLFQRFRRIARPEHENIRSTGLGLYLVRQCVEHMGGSVDGAGSTFHFAVPLDHSAGQQPSDQHLTEVAV